MQASLVKPLAATLKHPCNIKELLHDTSEKLATRVKAEAVRQPSTGSRLGLRGLGCIARDCFSRAL